MKVAEAKWTGRTDYPVKTGPSGEKYTFPTGLAEEDQWVPIEDPEDADYFDQDRFDAIEVEWTVLGRLKGQIESASDILDWGYQKKRQLAKKLDLSFSGNPSEEDLDVALSDEVEALLDENNI